MKKTQALTAVAMSILLFGACKKENQQLSPTQVAVSASIQDMISENGNNPTKRSCVNASAAGGGRVYTRAMQRAKHYMVYSQDAAGI